MLNTILVICTNSHYSKISVTTSIIKKFKTIIDLVVIHQGSNFLKKPGLRVINLPYQKGLSKARNTATKLFSQKSAIIWTDDDCITDKNYFKEITNIKKRKFDNKIAGVFGSTEAFESEKHIGEHCPSTFSKKMRMNTSRITNHATTIGLGNNMIIFSHVFKNIGGFKSWLGAGSIGKSGEDAEFIIRCLIAGYTFEYNQQLKIFHNKWVSGSVLRSQERSYISGGIAAYSFYLFQGVTECKAILLEHIRWCVKNILVDYKNINNRKPWEWHRNIIQILFEIEAVLWGLVIGYIFARIIPIPYKEDVVKRFYKSTND